MKGTELEAGNWLEGVGDDCECFEDEDSDGDGCGGGGVWWLARPGDTVIGAFLAETNHTLASIIPSVRNENNCLYDKKG